MTNPMSSCFSSLTQPVGLVLMSEDEDQTYSLTAMRLHDGEQSRQQRLRQAQAQPTAPTVPAAKMYPDLTPQAETKALKKKTKQPVKSDWPHTQRVYSCTDPLKWTQLIKDNIQPTWT